jgi:hypothetical protein
MMVKAGLTISEEVAFYSGRMLGLRLALLSPCALLVGAIAMPGAAAAQCRLCSAPTTQVTGDSMTESMRIEVQARLDFDQIVLTDGTGGGTARLLPDGTSSTSGAIGAIGGRAMVGTVVVRGEPGRLLRIDLPAAITLYGRTGSGSIRLDSLTTDLPAQPRLDSQGMLQFRFGGALHVDGGVDGDFRGDVPITVDYL